MLSDYVDRLEKHVCFIERIDSDIYSSLVHTCSDFTHVEESLPVR